MMDFHTRKAEQLVRYVAGLLILIVATVDILNIIGVKHPFEYDLLRSLVLVGIGLFIAFYKRPSQ